MNAMTNRQHPPVGAAGLAFPRQNRDDVPPRGSSSREVSDEDFEVREGQRSDALVTRQAVDTAVAPRSGIRVAEDEQAIALEVEDPVLSEPCPRVQRRLELAVVSQGGIRDLDEQEHVVRSGIDGGIVVRPGTQEQEIRLWLGKLTQPHWSLDTDDRAPSQSAREKRRHLVETGLVSPADRAHLDDFSFDQLDSVILSENPRLGHAVVVIDSEAVSYDDLSGHLASLSLDNRSRTRL
jgi:hypothetical protein